MRRPWLLIISGAVQGISLLGAREVPSFWLQLISVVLGQLVGLLLLRDLKQGLLTITLLLGVELISVGTALSYLALRVR